jgi:HK97 family phage major capsid protein
VPRRNQVDEHRVRPGRRLRRDADAEHRHDEDHARDQPFIGWLARSKSTATPSKSRSTATDAGAEWVGEVETRGETDSPQLGNFRCELHEIQAEPKVTQKLVDTARINIVDWLRDKVAEKFAYTETDAYFNGNGVKRPRGFLTTRRPRRRRNAHLGPARARQDRVSTAPSRRRHCPEPADHLIDLKSKLRNTVPATAPCS